MSVGTIEDLAKNDLLAELSEDRLADINRACTWQTYKKGEEILAQNSDSKDMYLVVKGHVQVVNYSLTGREIAYAILKEGSYFGELAAIDKNKRTTNVVAVKDCLLASLSPQAFEDLLKQNPEASWKVLNKLVGIIRSNDERIMDLSTLDAHQRIYTELLKLCEPDPVTPGRFMIYPLPTQQDIASLVSTTRETVARAISSLVSSDLVTRKGRTLYIADKDKLEELASQLASK